MTMVTDVGGGGPSWYLSYIQQSDHWHCPISKSIAVDFGALSWRRRGGNIESVFLLLSWQISSHRLGRVGLL